MYTLCTNNQSFMAYKFFTKLNTLNYEKVVFSVTHLTVIYTFHRTQNKPPTYPKSTSDKSLMKQAVYLTGLSNGTLKQQLYICVSVPLIVV